MSVSGVSSTPSYLSPAEAQERSSLGKEDFLKLLVTQLSNQDPMKPMENWEFSGQLAQFSSLEQLMGIGQGLGQLSVLQQAGQNAQVVNFVGREVTASGNWLEVGEERTVPPLGFELQGQAEHIQVELLDESGAVVARGKAEGRWEQGPHRLSEGEIQWENMPRLAPGSYRVKLEAQGENGDVGVQTRISGRVTGITYEQGYPVLMIGQHRVLLGDVISVGDGAQLGTGLAQ